MKKALIAYATWTGVSKSIAEEMGRVFKENEISFDLLSAKEVLSLDNYDLVILGTSIHASYTGRDFNKFLKKFQNTLVNIPTAFFVVCANMMDDNEKNRMETTNWLEKTTGKYLDIHPISVGLFGGAIIDDSVEFQRQFVLVKKMIYSMKEKMIEDYGKNDFRDLNKVRDWVFELIKQIP